MAAPVALKPGLSVHGSCKASFRGLTSAFQNLRVSSAVDRRQRLCVEGALRISKTHPFISSNLGLRG
jgi:hypothetical protein